MTRTMLSVRRLLENPPEGAASLVHSYRLVDDVTVAKGEIIGIQGRSGVGKTEFFRLIVDLLQRDGGVHLQYLPQELPLFPEMSVRSNVNALSGKRNLQEVLDQAPHLGASINGRAGWSPATLSGGEKRQLVLVAAASSHPELLLLDETFISLDDTRLNWSLSYLQEQVTHGYIGATLLVSHDSRVLARCDRVFEVFEEDGNRCLRRSPITQWSAIPVEMQLPTPTNQRQPRSTQLYFILRTVLGGLLAVALLLALLSSPRLWAAPEIAAVIPSMGGVAQTFRAEREIIASEGWWSLQSALAALVGSTLGGACFWLLTSISSGLRRVLSSTWIALQSVPVILFCPLIVILWGYEGRALEIAVAVFISVFPLGLIGARALAATPPDLLRAHNATGLLRRFTIASRYARGDLVRACVACAPLPAVGVIVAEYLIRQRGLGQLVHRGLADTVVFDRVYAYVVACVCLALCLVFFTTVAAVLILPRDVSAD